MSRSRFHILGGASAALLALLLVLSPGSVAVSAPDDPAPTRREPTEPETEPRDAPRVVEERRAPVESEVTTSVRTVDPALLPGRVDDIFIVLVPSRSVKQIRLDLTAARERQSDAEETLTTARSNEARAKAQIDVQKSTIEHLKSQSKLAKEEKRDADRLDYDRKRDAEQLILKAFERQRDLRKSEKSYADALREEAKQAINTYSVELKLAEARAERDLLAERGGDTDRAAAVERSIRGYETDALEMMKNHADKQGDVAGRLKNIMEQRQKVLSAQMDIRAADAR